MGAATRNASLLLVLLVSTLTAVLTFQAKPHRIRGCDDPKAFLDPERIPFEVAYSKVVTKGRVDGYFRPGPGERPLPFTLRRTFLIPDWLARPTHAIPGPVEPDRVEVLTLDVDGESVPATFAYEMKRADRRFAAYIFDYGGKPVRHPFWAQLFDAPAALFRGTRGITFLAVAADGRTAEVEELEAQARAWLIEAWRHYRRTCTP